jgi:antitoxin CcdA
LFAFGNVRSAPTDFLHTPLPCVDVDRIWVISSPIQAHDLRGMMLEHLDGSQTMQDGSPANATSSITLSIDAEVLQQARKAGIDLPAVVERALRTEIARTRKSTQWREDNRATIEAWNEDVRANGLWSDGLRQF